MMIEADSLRRTGQIDPSEGTATVAGCDIVKDRAKLKGLVGVVFEGQNLYDRLSARDNLRPRCYGAGRPARRPSSAQRTSAATAVLH